MNMAASSMASRVNQRENGGMPSAGIPPLAGLGSYAQAARVGPSVEPSVRLLRRLSQVERRTMLVLAAQLNAVPE